MQPRPDAAREPRHQPPGIGAHRFPPNVSATISRNNPDHKRDSAIGGVAMAEGASGGRALRQFPIGAYEMAGVAIRETLQVVLVFGLASQKAPAGATSVTTLP